MGTTSSVLHPSVVQLLASQTNFSKKEIRMLHRCFRQATPKKRHLTKESFVDLFHEAFPDADCVRFAEHAFRLYDKDNNGHVDFNEFVFLLNNHLKGGGGEKLEVLFQLYDVERNNLISKDEAMEIIHHLHRLNGGLVPKEDVATADIVTNSLFSRFEGDIMDSKEFYKLAHKNNTMRELLNGTSHALYKPLLFGEFDSPPQRLR